MKLEDKIKHSGKKYFSKLAPELNVVDLIPKVKQTSWMPSWVVGSLGLSSVVSLFIIFTISLQSSNPLPIIERDFSGLTNMNTVAFPNPLSRVDLSEDVLTPFALQTSTLLWDDVDTNLVYSPLSLYLTLGMVLEASAGETYEEIASLLAMDSLDQLRNQMQTYYQHFYADEWDDNQLLSRLRLHQAMFFQDDLPIEENYQNVLTNHYYAELFSSDFSNQAKQGISDWINERTFNFLDVKPEDLGVSSETVMALYQTYYLLSNWKQPFENSFHYQAAFNEGKLQVRNDHTFMKKGVSDSPLWQHEDFTLAGDRAYGNQTVYYLIPENEQSLEDVWQEYQSDIMGFTKNPSLSDFYLHIPKTKVTTKTSLKPLLEDLGMIKAFTNEADFSKASPNLFIESIQQEAGFALNENGVEAAAYTEVDFEVTSSPNPSIDVRVNESFIMFIVSDQGAISLMSLVKNLS